MLHIRDKTMNGQQIIFINFMKNSNYIDHIKHKRFCCAFLHSVPNHMYRYISKNNHPHNIHCDRKGSK